MPFLVLRQIFRGLGEAVENIRDSGASILVTLFGKRYGAHSSRARSTTGASVHVCWRRPDLGCVPTRAPIRVPMNPCGLTSSTDVGRSSQPPSVSTLIRACAHNSTGVDPTRERWGQIVDVAARVGTWTTRRGRCGSACGGRRRCSCVMFVSSAQPVSSLPPRRPRGRPLLTRRANSAELREGRRKVRRAYRRAARRVADEGGCGTDQEPTVGDRARPPCMARVSWAPCPPVPHAFR